MPPVTFLHPATVAAQWCGPGLPLTAFKIM
jgi:hypothetical protein